MNELLPLGLLPAGHIASVAHIFGEPSTVQRLKELGFRDGAQVEMIQSGHACIVRLDGHKLGFRADDAVRILVRLDLPLGAVG